MFRLVHVSFCQMRDFVVCHGGERSSGYRQQRKDTLPLWGRVLDTASFLRTTS